MLESAYERISDASHPWRARGVKSVNSGELRPHVTSVAVLKSRALFTDYKPTYSARYADYLTKEVK